MTQVEFLEPDPEPGADGPEQDGGDDRHGSSPTGVPAWRRPAALATAAAVALTAAGCVLAVLGCWRAEYSVSLGGAFGGGQVAVDGWGRYAGDVGGNAGQHGTRLGIVVCVAAGIAVLGLAVGLVVARRRPQIALATGLLAAGAAAATAGNALLAGAATVESYRAVLRADRYASTPEADARRDVVLHVGGFVWLAAVAAACFAVAAVLPALPRRGDPALAADAAPTGAPVPARVATQHEDDELLA